METSEPSFLSDLRAWAEAGVAPGLRILVCDAEGRGAHLDSDLCRRAVTESLRWGEPQLLWQDDEHLLLAVALVNNQRLVGGVLLPDLPVNDEQPQPNLAELHRIGLALLDWLQRHNHTNQALLREHREQGLLQRTRAEAVHEAKLLRSSELRREFLHLQPEFLLALRRGDRQEARRLLNALLIHVYNVGQGSFDRVRELIAELVLRMKESAREFGVDPLAHPLMMEPVWDTLLHMEDEEQLSPWFRQTLEELMDLIGQASVHPGRSRVRLVLDYLQRHYARPLGRDEVARLVGLAPSEFSRMMRRETGRSFSEHLCGLRIDAACRLLRQQDLTIQEVAYRCGFEEQAYFSRRFKAHTGLSPRQYRAANG